MSKKNLLSLVLALAMVFCFVLPTMAEEALTIDVSGKLVILHTNDIHGRAVSGDGVLGYSRIAQVKADLELLGASVLLLDAGDATQGTPVVNLSQGKTAIEFMSAAGYDAMTLGNHEFDWGFDNLQQILEGASFDVLCANITDSISGESVFTPSKIYEMTNGMKVGIFGLDTPETMTKAHPDKVKGITFAMNEDLYAVAQAQVEELKTAGADIVICLGHLGVDDESAPNRSIDVIESTNGIDIFVDAHSHTDMDGGELSGATLLTSTGSYGANLGYIILDGKNIVKSGNYTGVDGEVEGLVNTIDAQVTEELGVAFATTEVLLNGERAPGVRTEETNLGNFSTDAILWSAQQSLGEDKVVAAIGNGGNIRTTIEIGDITMLTMKTVFPFDNQVVTLTVTGAELLEAIEAACAALPEASGAFPQVAGIVYTVDTSVPYKQGEAYPDSTYFAPAKPGSRVTIATVGGKAFDLEALYSIATNDFLAAGGDTYYAFRYAYQTSGIDTGVALEDALVNYTKEVLGGVVGEQYAAPEGRITIK